MSIIQLSGERGGFLRCAALQQRRSVGHDARLTLGQPDSRILAMIERTAPACRGQQSVTLKIHAACHDAAVNCFSRSRERDRRLVSGSAGALAIRAHLPRVSAVNKTMSNHWPRDAGSTAIRIGDPSEYSAAPANQPRARRGMWVQARPFSLAAPHGGSTRRAIIPPAACWDRNRRRRRGLASR